MKPSMLGLLIAAGAFGASAIYLGMQLQEERARADEFLDQSRVLNARVAELERARADLEALRITTGTAMVSESFAPVGAPEAPLDASPASLPPEVRSQRFEPGPSPSRSEAMNKMLRSQLRANLRRQQGDLGEKLGLGAEQTQKLVDLLVDQQIALLDRRQEQRLSNLTPEQRLATWNEQQERNQAEIAALIGADKMDAYADYQKSLPARQEVDMLSRQLEANDRSLTADQRTALIAALSEERQRVPAPTLTDSASREEYGQVMTAWQQDYNERAAARAAGILTKDQQATYSEYQQWTAEMRQQFEASRGARGSQGGLPARSPGGSPRP